MNILMVSNTFTPHVGGVAKSVAAFTRAYRKAGHRVMVIAPEFEGMPENEEDVIRLPAIQNFNGSDFSVRLPIPGLALAALDEFEPHVVHSHHPFLLGHTALLIAAKFNVPLVFTHHTMYERYTHYVPLDSPAMKRFVIQLSTGYANLCDMVFTPSQSIAETIRERGVTAPIEVVPTGVDLDKYKKGDGRVVRKQLKLPSQAFVVGHTGRLAPEKNLEFLARSVARFMSRHPDAHFLVVGDGPSRTVIQSILAEQSLDKRLHFTGSLTGARLVNAYHAMDLFAFSSTSETQGMVLVEAMAAGVPVVALDAPGAREVVIDRKNGRLLPNEDVEAFADALHWYVTLDASTRAAVKKAAHATSKQFSMDNCARRALNLYESLLQKKPVSKDSDDSLWDSALRVIEKEWNYLQKVAHSAGIAISKNSSD